MKQMYKNKYHTALISDAYGGMGLDPWPYISFLKNWPTEARFTVSLGCSCFAAFYACMVPNEHLVDKFITPLWNVTMPAS